MELVYPGISKLTTTLTTFLHLDSLDDIITASLIGSPTIAGSSKRNLGLEAEKLEDKLLEFYILEKEAMKQSTTILYFSRKVSLSEVVASELEFNPEMQKLRFLFSALANRAKGKLAGNEKPVFQKYRTRKAL
jgi:hypothetical protein